MFNNKTLFVTGGTGSFGKQFIKTVLSKYKPKKIIIYSRDELKQYEMQCDPYFEKYYKKDILRFFIGDVRDLPRLQRAMKNDVSFVVHAAALKQVPAAEYNPFEAVKTNIVGGQNIIDASIESEVRKVIALSTDKACSPINLYGATKLVSDKLFAAANNYVGDEKIKFSVVRYGNVMGSRGSVIPFFLEKRKTGVLPVTDKRMTRFNITLKEGVDFVIECFDKMWGGELFIPKIPSYRIMDVVNAIDNNCKVKITGIRPGEKIHEEMISITDAISTVEYDDYFVILPSTPQWDIDDFIKRSNSKKGKLCSYGFSYNSGTNEDFITVDKLKKIINNLDYE
ncbi:UDP-N-acetylglucosamine 4,6-dehydratase (inverting) [Candidatus Woesearchaeota archaeon]|nr:UDP-N-acetylglucosamine 4,6-dehydratase (inverting) [Candidatus Woesearchaeota archaeon]